MKKSHHTTPRVFPLMWMMSHSKLIAKQFYIQFLRSSVMMDRVVFFSRKVSNPGHGTKIARGLVRYEDIGYCSIKSMSLLKPGTTRCHGTRIARGVPLPVYINLDLYSGFWCTSRCVVF